MKQMIAGKGFNCIISTLIYSSYASSQAAMCTLVERWIDTTHTFHLSFGEMTITPLDFAAITGLNFSREPVPFSSVVYSSVVVRNIWLKELFGVTFSIKFDYYSLIRYTHLVDKVKLEHDASRVSSE